MKETSSLVMSALPIIDAIQKAERLPEFGANRVWRPKNAVQEQFLAHYYGFGRRALPAIPEIEGMASLKASEINEFLAKHGCTVKLQEFMPLEFGVASVLDLLMHWQVEGEKRPVYEDGRGGNVYPGVYISNKEGQQNLSFWRVEGHTHPIAQLATQGGDMVMMTIADCRPASAMHLLRIVEEIEANLLPSKNTYGGVHFPMVDLQQKIDVGWLVDMATTGADGMDYRVSQAIMEAIGKMDHKGVRMKVGFGAGIMKCSRGPEDVEINAPFLLWIKRPGINQPLVCAYIAQDDWKDPGSLEGANEQPEVGGLIRACR